MTNISMYLAVFVAVTAAIMIGLVNGDCASDIANCSGGGTSTANPANLTTLTVNSINAVCTDTTSMNNAINQGKCVYTTIQTAACSSQYGSISSSLPPIDWDRILSSYVYVCANKDAYVRALTCIAQYTTNSQYTQCASNAYNSVIAGIDRSKSQADQVMQTYCALEKRVEEMCWTNALLPNCQSGDLNVVKTATVLGLPPACAACGLASFSIICMILYALTMSIL